MVSSRFLIAATALFIMTVAARADSIWTTAGAAGATMELGRVQIKGIEDGKLIFLATAGRESSRDLRQIARIAAESEPALNAAEEAFAKGQFEAATDGYRKALASSAKEWVKYWAAQRLTVAGQKANRFDAAASGYIALLTRDPARAADLKPTLPAAQSTFLTSAINEANAALATPTLSPESKQALQAFAAELQQAKGSSVPAAAAGAPAAPGVQPTTPQPAGQTPQPGAVAAALNAATVANANQQAARQKLDAAGAALERKDFAGAINEIKSNSKIFLEPRDQAQALYFIAEAQTGLAAAKNDVPAWQDAALAYMRVVAHFSDAAPARPLVARSMLKAAQIHETLRDPAAARTLYEQLTKEFPSDPAANDAKAALERLKPKQ